MAVDSAEIERRLSAFVAALRSNGLRLTHQRLEVARELAGGDSHPDAETVYRAVRAHVPTISLDTVYRTLWLLSDMGLITTLGLPRERYRFDGNMRPHHHFVCTRCGLTGDFYSEELDRLSVAETVKEFGVADRTQVEVRGLCRNCVENEDTTR